jgi:peptide/nickel transport system ATP-binding protein
MSGGQKQRVMIAMVLAGEPDFLVADEPTTALDVTIQAQILDLLRDLQREQGMGLLLITHDLAVVSGMAQHVALMYAGQIIEVASADEFFQSPKHPYARLLLRALPDAAKRGDTLAAIAGTVPPMWQQFDGCRFAPRCDRARDSCHVTPPPLMQITPVTQQTPRSVRCLLYTDGSGVQTWADDAVVTRVAEAPRAVGADPAVLLDVHDLSVRFPIRSGLLQRVKGAFTAVDSSANPGAARRPPARPSCSCCATSR